MDAFGDAEIISSKGTARKVRSLTSVRTYPTTQIDQEYRIQEGELQVIMVPVGGHTSESSYLVFPHDNIIFAGDLIFENYLFFAGYQSDPLIWLKALKTFRDMKPDKIIPGHGPVLETPHDLDKHISLLQSFIETIRGARSARIPPKEIEIPEYIYGSSKKAPSSELEKWFYRTAISWYKRV
jgi:glyoxylase-like metal-dependent hydrolase (beta-lactamase superfamily II)